MRFTVGVIAAVQFAGAALAADFRVQRDPPIEFTPMPASTWTGAYAGLHGGYAGSRTTAKAAISDNTYFNPASNLAAVANASAALGLSSGGPAGGLQIGYNWELRSGLVAGVESDLTAMPGFGGATITAPYATIANPAAPIPNAFTVTQKVRNDWLATARGRVGVTMNNVLLFITGGLALGGATSQRTFVDNTTWVQMETASTSSTRVGWTIGAGAEWAFSPSWTVQAQYLYADLGAVSNSGVIGPPPPPNNTTTMRTSARLTRQIGSLGVNYHF